MKFVIEHMDDEVFEWCILEYKHMSEVVGSENMIFTNVPPSEAHKLKGFGQVMRESVLQLGLNRCCLLEMDASKELSADDLDKFDYMVYGGILGDDPPQGRTKALKKLNCDMRNLGVKQMSTDTAVFVSKMILDGKKMKDIKFQDTITLDIAEGEEVILSFRYVIEDGKPVLPEGLIEMLREQEGF